MNKLSDNSISVSDASIPNNEVTSSEAHDISATATTMTTITIALDKVK
jgi:hypothetical protein